MSTFHAPLNEAKGTFFSVVIEGATGDDTIAVAEEASDVRIATNVSLAKEAGTEAALPVEVQKRRRSVNIGKYVAFLSRAQSFSS